MAIIPEPLVVSVVLFNRCPKPLDYIWTESDAPKPGQRVSVPFRTQQVVGVVWSTVDQPIATQKCKPIKAVLDPKPLIDPVLWSLLAWIERYHHAAIHDVLSLVYPKSLQQGGAPETFEPKSYQATQPEKKEKLTPSQQKLYEAICSKTTCHTHDITAQGFKQKTLEILIDKGYVLESNDIKKSTPKTKKNMSLTQEQKAVVDAIPVKQTFGAHLIDGVTGSGKTIVYCALMEQALAQKKQVLLLVPEINLTPQTIAFFAQYFDAQYTMMHSGLNDRQRAQAWMAAQTGTADIIIGTRSAVFAPMPRLGLILIDEEHDMSYKQQNNLRYHARDVAIKRAHMLNIPVVMGTATPSLESQHNANTGKYTYHKMPSRHSGQPMPPIQLVDLKGQPIRGGLSPKAVERMREHLEKKQQVLLFLNRRGYAPVLLCHQCGWQGVCPHCDANLTLHQAKKRLVCHHCDHQAKQHEHCPSCLTESLTTAGVGTERLKETVAKRFPDIPISCFDRDHIPNIKAFSAQMAAIDPKSPHILIGTQMLAKGHHLPNLTLSIIVDGDTYLYHPDFRNMERMAQTLVQVAGRSGRGEKAGEVLLQTHNTNHPLLADLLAHRYDRFAQKHLVDRAQALLPPMAHLAVLRAESKTPHEAINWLKKIKKSLPKSDLILGPIPLHMARKGGFHRAQLMVSAPRRVDRHNALTQMQAMLWAKPNTRYFRWHLDVDPLETL